ncbi:membrane protein [Rhodovulum sp. NI22]|nr:membrane protein [Rhodovulum sp. NI22]
MHPTMTRPADRYSPLYFLVSLGAGGLAVTFFMYLMFWVPHPTRPVPVFEDVAAAFAAGGLPMQLGIVAAYIGITVFVVLNLRSLVWNITRYRRFRQTEAFRQLVSTNAETQLLAMPLAMAMSVNAAFIAGMVFVPGLWSIIEYLFPFALVAFAAIGWLAFRFLGDFLGRVLTTGGVFDVTAHNSFAQLLPAFALSMVAVGFAAPAAMSVTPLTIGISVIGSTFFGVASVLYAVVAAITGFNSMLHYGTAKESGPTLLVVVPIMTVLGIMLLRQEHGLHVAFDAQAVAVETLVTLTRLMSVQVVFLMLGLLVLRRQEYFKQYVFGADNSPGAYALICPGVALSVMIQFWLNKGLVAAGLVAKFSTGYWLITAIATAFQISMIWLVFHLNRRHFGQGRKTVAVPAE